MKNSPQLFFRSMAIFAILAFPLSRLASVQGESMTNHHPLSFVDNTAINPSTSRVSLATDGSQGNNASSASAISSDGRFVAFVSLASNLVSGDTNGHQDIFVRDRQSGSTQRVSVSSEGVQGNGWSRQPSISADGRYLAFASKSSNLVSGDTNNGCTQPHQRQINCPDVFVHDRETGITERVSVSSEGSQGNNLSDAPSISADGRFVTFASEASNLVSGDTNDSGDIFVYDRQTGNTERVSVSSNGAEGNDSSETPSISSDGRYVAFSSWANNLVGGDTNSCSVMQHCEDVFVHDRQSGVTERVSISSDGREGNYISESPSISANGRYIVFHSWASNLVNNDTNECYGYSCADVFLHDRKYGSTQRVSVSSDGIQGNHGSVSPSISADGRYVVFGSYASNLVDGDTNAFGDIFIHTLLTGSTERVSVSSDGDQGNHLSEFLSISVDGRYVAFSSWSSNLVSGDTNSFCDWYNDGVLDNCADIFVRDRGGTFFRHPEFLPVVSFAR